MQGVVGTSPSVTVKNQKQCKCLPKGEKGAKRGIPLSGHAAELGFPGALCIDLKNAVVMEKGKRFM